MTMKLSKYLLYFVLIVAASSSLVSCSSDDLGPTIFPDTGSDLDSTAATYKLDKWLRQNFLDVYNLDFQYKMQDVGTDMNYNLVPATYDKSLDLAVLTKYLWFDVYNKIAGPEFLKLYGPRIIALIGSPAYNPTSGTIILGLAEGGIKVSLFRVNELDASSFNQLNEYYFKTMHHEFAHILHQTKSIPREFQLISTGHYDSSNWQDRQDGVVNSLGFVTPYASSEVREDYAEVIANYITKTDAQWAHILDYASRGWATDATDLLADNVSYYCFYYYNDNVSGDANKKYLDESLVVKDVDSKGNTVYYYSDKRDSSGNRIIVYPVEDKDGVDGKAIILQKVNIARAWFKDEWNVNLDSLRKEVQVRQLNFNLDSLRQEVENVK
jgi:substrate import-associated zinc metallohydrolase lipoprotein